MTLTAFTKIPESVAVGAQLTLTMSTAKNVSESGNTSRKSLRPVKRNYLVTISPDDSDEMQAIIMAMRGDRYPVAMRDYKAYQLNDESCQLDPVTGDYMIGRTWAPATGSRSYFERVLVPDNDILVSVNGSPATTSGFTLSDFGRIQISGGTSTGDDVSVTGTYLKPVCLLDNPTANAFGSVGGVTQYQFASLRFEELFESELRALTA